MNDETIDYRSAGVDVAAGQRLVRDIGAKVAATQGPEVLGNLGGFAGLYALGNYRDPVLVSGTDGVGTKVELARAAGRLDTIGIDLVAMCVNDVICHGARPLFFLDYIAVDDLSKVDAAAIVSGVAEGCRRAGCALIGGETAEMPGVYRPGGFDLAGFAVGAVERDEIIDGSALEPGMAVVGLASSGFHSNGYSLLRKLFPEVAETGEADTTGVHMNGGRSAGVATGANRGPGSPSDSGIRALRDALLTPTRIYAAVVADLTAQCRIAGIAHVTGGGWWENLPRMLGTRRTGAARTDRSKPSNGDAGDRPAQISVVGGAGAAHPETSPLRLVVDAQAVPLPETCNMIMYTPLSPPEAYRTFNMGLGLAVALPAAEVQRAIGIAAGHGIEAWQIGTVEQQLLEAAGVPDDVPTTDVQTTSDADPRTDPIADPAIEITGIPTEWFR